MGFYTDCLGNAHWSLPEEVIDEKLASSLIFTADILSHHERKVTTREIELWINYMQPTKNMDGFSKGKAISNWYAALQSEGLIDPGENHMEHFVFGK